MLRHYYHRDILLESRLVIVGLIYDIFHALQMGQHPTNGLKLVEKRIANNLFHVISLKIFWDTFKLE